MPMFSNIRDSRGRFVGHGVANDLENALTDALTNVNPSSWKRFWTLTEQRLGMNPWDFLRQHGGRIPVGALTAGGGAPPPPVGTGGFRPVMQGSAQMVTFHKDIHTMSHDIHQLLGLQQRAFQGGAGVHAAAAAYGGLPFRHGMLGPQTIMNWPGTLMTQGGPGLLLRALGGMGTGGAGGGFGGGGGRGGGFGRGFGGGALAGLLPPGFRRLAGEAGEGFIGYETLKFLMNPIAFATNAIVNPFASASKRAWDFRRGMLGAAGPMVNPNALSARIAPSTAPSLGIARDTTLPEWMIQLGMGPEDAADLVRQYGIPGRSVGEHERNLQMLGAAREGLTDRFLGFRGLDPGAVVGMARTGMARGLGGRGELADTNFLDKFSETMKIAVAEGADRASVFSKMQESLQMLSRSGATGISGDIDKLFNLMLKSGLPGGGTGEAAQAMIGGELGAIKTIGVDPRRSLVAANLFGKYGGDLERMVGPEVMRNLTPVQAKALEQAKDLAKRGAILPAFQLLQEVLSSDVGAERWRQLSQEGAGMFMPGMPGMQTLFGAGTAGIGAGDWLGAQIAGQTGGGNDANFNWGGIRIPRRGPGGPIANPAGWRRFSTPEAGVLGVRDLLKSYGKSGYRTIRSIISRWAPSNENDTAALIKRASMIMGVDPDEQLNMDDPKTMGGLVNSVIRNEHGGALPRGLSQATIDRALAGGTGAALWGENADQGMPASTALPQRFGNLLPGIPTHTFESMAVSQGAGLAASVGWADAVNIKAFTEDIGKASTAVENFAIALGAAIRAAQQSMGITPAPVVTPQTTQP